MRNAIEAKMRACKVAKPLVDDPRLGNSVTVTIVFGLLIGMSLTEGTLVFGAVLNAIVN